MDGIFSTREIALGIWTVGLLVWATTSKGIRQSLSGVVRAFFQRPILIIFGLMIAYVVLVVLGLRRVGLWEIRQLKDTILWTMFVGGASMFRLTAIARDSSYFLQTIKDNLKLIVFIEFIVNVFVFSLPLELLLVPVATVGALVFVIAERDEKNAVVTKFLNNVMMIFGVWLLGHAVYYLFKDFSGFANIQTLADFSLTPILTICFVPFLYLAARYEHHGRFSQRLKQAIKDPAIRRYAYRRALLRFRLNVAALDRWATSLFSRSTNGKVDIDRSIDRILAILRAEKHPSVVTPDKGWSPYAAKDYLKAEGFNTGYYTSCDDIEWYASVSQDVAKRSLNTIEYMIEGDREAAMRLKLKLTCYQAEAPADELLHFVKVFKSLYETALQAKMNNGFEELEATGQRWIVGNREISMHKEVWKHREGYELEIRIELIDPEGNLIFRSRSELLSAESGTAEPETAVPAEQSHALKLQNSAVRR